ncbi:MAG TPA: hydroxymethylpyrimidine/phosphomethylpyrimidine kinase [Zoogloea sp.]|uniref:bifunctional hydroxymethylpyrimidine kinase/phosphomethylpyrimidine kinase n=1 Tax=Zoogloea sp. TaxID=49181 RepID=UPI002C36B13B|nr:hydroxymethylpyrimidine/phosphomethylpyrimidine kinase [Zoogloea sp.]HMV17296.1 hydroxymethylpyrimidine/phosphomethylpyrimidine kinase [Rhodocyclaceae bacterium]HMV64499.1 hydroxymethylpyrimidine/phosphomethylpyrimidine kinase [Rhodocyclaceae bacterium]HMW51350.1 hydroxymethylpyrimidine/phosphomethylpyrimidine kinase [Rhodocyclaceae bacterium]HMY49280.1 hydroxymethylpyrimidine/phosphomethylpyrimidine kinase [Rhodocyclaceae bacterium]HMZ76487.1 hydroxymethylpyrimidine/phosphomethylpyrimidine
MISTRSDPSPPLVMVFAASDPTGGAGIQADIMTLSGMGCHALTVITALTVQDTAGVEAVLPTDAEFVDEQARALLEDMPVQAFKLGVLGSLDNIEVIARILADYPHVPVVVDPVIASGRGDELASESMLEGLCELILPQATVVTPNTLEARRLAARHRDDDDTPTLAECARRMVAMGCEYVLITGSHEHSVQVINTLYGRGGVVRADTWERLPGAYHGSGCTLASAVAAALARGLEVPVAVRDAQEFTWQTLAYAFRPGMGQHIPDRFFWARPVDDGED